MLIKLNIRNLDMKKFINLWRLNFLIKIFIIFFIAHFLFGIDVRDIIFPELKKILNFINEIRGYTFMKYFDISYFLNDLKNWFNFNFKKPVVPVERVPDTFYVSFKKTIGLYWEDIVYPIGISEEDGMIDIVWKTWLRYGPISIGFFMVGMTIYRLY